MSNRKDFACLLAIQDTSTRLEWVVGNDDRDVGRAVLHDDAEPPPRPPHPRNASYIGEYAIFVVAMRIGHEDPRLHDRARARIDNPPDEVRHRLSGMRRYSMTRPDNEQIRTSILIVINELYLPAPVEVGRRVECLDDARRPIFHDRPVFSTIIEKHGVRSDRHGDFPC
jgi:hypothetical protein